MPPTSFTLLLAGAGCIRDSRLRRRHRERGTSHREKYEQPRARASERGWIEDRGCGTPKGCDRWGEVDILLGISTYDCPGGVHRSAKQSSPGLDPSRALRALFPTPPERGNVSRYTREHRGVGYLSAVRCRCCCLVSSSIYSTGTHDLRNSRRSPMALPPSVSLSFFLARSPHCIYVYSVYPADPQRSFSLTGEADQPASRIYGARNSDDARSSSHVTSGNSINFFVFSLRSLRHTDIFLRAG